MELCRATPSPPPAGLTPGVTFQSGAGSPCLTMFFPTGPRCHKSSELRWDSCWALSSRACGEGEDAQGREKEIVRAIGLTSNQWPRAPKSCDVVNLGSSRPWDPQFRGWGGPAAWAGCQCYQIWVGATSWPEVFGSFRARNCPLVGRQGTEFRNKESRQKRARESRPNPRGLGFKTAFCPFPKNWMAG